jgi:hypothetical protein
VISEGVPYRRAALESGLWPALCFGMTVVPGHGAVGGQDAYRRTLELLAGPPVGPQD